MGDLRNRIDGPRAGRLAEQSLRSCARLIGRAFLLAAALSGPTLAQPSPPPPRAPAPSDSSIRIMVLTMGQGDPVWELFGHNAIWIHDPAVSPDSVYNWGVFDFHTPGFLVRFLRGDMRYTMD